MAAEGSPDLSVEEIITILQSDTTTLSDRVSTYSKFNRLVRESDVGLFSLDVCSNVSKICAIIQKDLLLDRADVSQEALQLLGVCLHESDMSRNLSLSEACSITGALCQCIMKTEDKAVCARALWCVGKQNLIHEAIQKQLENILSALDHSIEKWKGLSNTVENESVNTIARLAEQAPKEMESYGARWGKILLLLVSHNALKVRERTLAVLEATQHLLKRQHEELMTKITPAYKTKICPELRKLLSAKHEHYVLKCWGVLVQFFGEEMHRGSFVNHILPVVELGFKSVDPEVKIAAFNAWQNLIDNFATNQNILCDPKRVKLIMQVFKLNNTKVESVAMAKLEVWWHFIWMLNNKLSTYFDQTALPFIMFCKGGAISSDSSGAATPRSLKPGMSPATPKMNLQMTNSATAYPVFPVLQIRGCEALAQFLGGWPDDLSQDSSFSLDKQQNEQYRFQLTTLRQPVVSGPSFFVKNASHFITSAVEMFISLGKDVPEPLVCHIWYSLIAHMKNAINSPTKTDIRETLNLFLSQFQVIILSQTMTTPVLLKLFQAICCLPKKALCSTAYNISGDQMISGTPGLFLMELLLTPVLLQSNYNNPSYFDMFITLIDCGMGYTTGTLSFLHSVLQLLERNAQFVTESETLCKFWTALVDPLLEHVKKTNEVNQGDALEHNFDCIYAALMFPLTQGMLDHLSSASVKSLQKMWAELYKTSAWLTSMVVNAEANILCENVCQRVVDLTKDKEQLTPVWTDFLVQIASILTHAIDFSSLRAQPSFGLSPGKWNKRRQRPLENIHSLVMLLSRLQDEIVTIVTHEEKLLGKKQQQGASPQVILNGLLDLLSFLFCHVPTTTLTSNLIGQLAQPMGKLFAKVHYNTILPKLEKLWLDICTCVQAKYNSIYDTEFLEKMSPLLEVTFLHSRRQIKNRTLTFWKATFSNSSTLEYPEQLKPILQKVKDKTSLQLPGWVAMDTIVIEETPVSQMTQSQAPEPHIPGMPSPHKIHGSLLHNKAVSPGPKKSPARVPAVSPHRGSAKKKILSFGAFNDEDFVVIRSPPRKRLVLTEHQKEVMKERKTLPAMYNTLEMSQDASMMMSQFNTDTQQGMDTSDTPTPTPTTESVVLFGSVVPAYPGRAATTKLGTPEGKGTDSKSKEKQGTSQRRSVRIKESSQTLDRTESLSADDSAKIDNSQNKVSTSSSDTEKDKDITVRSRRSTRRSIISKISESNSQPGDNVTDSPVISSSIPQNQLGLPEVLSSGLSSSDPAAQGTSSTTTTIDSESEEKMETSSEPLFSWTQKLNQLSQSPAITMYRSPEKRRTPQKRSLSQDSARKSSSPRPSPRKSPARGSKKLISDENAGKLDKWLIRSPTKEVIGEVNFKQPLTSQTVMSATIVEETQSPKKLLKVSEEEGLKENSILETPPKQVELGSQSVLSVSGRKLFQESQNTLDMNEDSCIVPASPASKSNCNSPILKLKRLSTDEIQRYSPKRKDYPILNLTPTKVTPNKTPKLKAQTKSANTDKTSHKHDDFSEIKPLNESEGPLSDTDEYDPCLTSTFMDSNSASQSSQPSSESQSRSDQNNSTRESDVTISSQDSQSEQEIPFDIQANSTLIENTPRRSRRKRKQGTPKKFSPDDFPKGRKRARDSPEEKGEDDIKNTPVSTRKARSAKLRKSISLNDDVIVIASDTEEVRVTDKSDDCKGTETISNDVITGRSEEEQQKSKVVPYEQGAADDSVETPTDSGDKHNDSVETSTDSGDKHNEDVMVVDSNENVSSEISSNDDKNTSGEVKGKDEGQSSQQTRPDPDCDESEEKGPRQMGQEELSQSLKVTVDQSENEPDDDVQMDVDEEAQAEDSLSLFAKVDNSEKMSDEGNMTKLDSKPKDDNIKEVSHDEDKKEDKLAADDVILIEDGEKTPQSRNSSKQPERKSTTKKKKEMAQRRVKKLRKNVVVIDSESPIKKDNESSDEDCSLSVTQKKIVAKKSKKKGLLLGSNTEKDSQENKGDDEEPTSLGKKDNESSDENCSLYVTQKKMGEKELLLGSKPEKDISENKGEEEQEPEPKDADISLHLSSDDDVPLNLLIKGQEKSTESISLNSEEDMPSKSTQEKSTESISLNSEEDMPSKSTQEKATESISLNSEEDMPSKSTQEKATESISLNSEEDMPSKITQASLTEKCVDISIDREEDVLPKITRQNKLTVGNVSLDLNSEKDIPTKITRRKLTAGRSSPASNKWQTGVNTRMRSSPIHRRSFTLTRRSILKPSLYASEESASPKKDFHPIKVAQIYSPTASPSASILKKRRLSGQLIADSASPPTKSRRVSFADPLSEIDLIHSVLNLPTEQSDRETKFLPEDRQLNSLSSASTTQSGINSNQASSSSDNMDSIATPTATPSATPTATPSQNSYYSTQESQLNSTDPVYSPLLDCKLSVEKILPQLTSSMWSRGFGQLVRARNIHTIGDLCALTEAQINDLPIKPPKTETVYKVLSKFEQTLRNKQAKTTELIKEKGLEEVKTGQCLASEDTSALKTKTSLLSEDKPQTRTSSDQSQCTTETNKQDSLSEGFCVDSETPSAQEPELDTINKILGNMIANEDDSDLSCLTSQELVIVQKLFLEWQMKVCSAQDQKLKSPQN